MDAARQTTLTSQSERSAPEFASKPPAMVESKRDLVKDLDQIEASHNPDARGKCLDALTALIKFAGAVEAAGGISNAVAYLKLMIKLEKGNKTVFDVIG